MIAEFPPALLLLVGALIMPVVPESWRARVFLVFPFAAMGLIWTLPEGPLMSHDIMGHELILLQVDPLSRGFGLVFTLAAFAMGIYSLHLRDLSQQVSALIYVGGALGVTFAGDFFTLLMFWEVMAVSSAFLIWAGRTPQAQAAGFRYLIFHLFGGTLLLVGVVLLWFETGDLTLRVFEVTNSPAVVIILIGFLVNAGAPPLHAWAPDGYPKSTVTGSVFLSAFTTKVAVYVLAQTFLGWDVLYYVGIATALYAVYYAVLAVDIRLILAYHIISQVGYMLAAIGLGGDFALSAAAGHAYNNIIYKSLLFMGAGAVLYSVGTTRLTDLGGLGKRMPWVVALYMIGAFAISGFPLFAGFVSKGMVLSASVDHGGYGSYFLLLASVGTFLSVGIKLPYYTWFYRDSGLKPKPVPRGMIVGMAILAALCLAIGIWPNLLLAQLPVAVDFHSYTVYHVVEAVQLPLFTFLAFWIFRHKILGEAKIGLDTDWFYRRPAPFARRVMVDGVNAFFDGAESQVRKVAGAAIAFARNPPALGRAGKGDYDPDRDRFPLGATLMLTLLAVVVTSVLIIF